MIKNIKIAYLAAGALPTAEVERGLKTHFVRRDLVWVGHYSTGRIIPPISIEMPQALFANQLAGILAPVQALEAPGTLYLFVRSLGPNIHNIPIIAAAMLYAPVAEEPYLEGNPVGLILHDMQGKAIAS